MALRLPCVMVCHANNFHALAMRLPYVCHAFAMRLRSPCCAVDWPRASAWATRHQPRGMILLDLLKICTQSAPSLFLTLSMSMSCPKTLESSLVIKIDRRAGGRKKIPGASGKDSTSLDSEVSVGEARASQASRHRVDSR